MFKELKNSYYNEEHKYFSIDGWLTENQNEEGISIAKVYKDKVEYKKDSYAKLPEVIDIVEKTKTKFIKKSHCNQYERICLHMK